MFALHHARFFCRLLAPLIFLSLASLASAQINGVTNPNIGTTSQTLNPADVFTGTLTVGTVGQNFGTLSLSGNFLSALPIVLTGNQTTLTSSGGPFTLTLTSLGSLTRTGGVTGNYSTVSANTNLINAGNIVVNSGTLYVNGNLTNTGTANVTGAGSVLSLAGLNNSGGTIVANSGGLLSLTGNYVTGNLGTISLTGGTPGTVEITGNLDNTGGNLTGGPFVLNGGTIKNGTVVDTAFSPKINGTLDGATILGNITIGSTQNLTLTNNGGATLTTTVGTVGQNFGQLLIGANVATQVGSNLVLTGNQTLLNNSGGTRTLTIVAGSNLTRTGGVSGNYSSVFTNLNNAGNIVVNSGTLYDYGTLISSGNVSVSAGANLLQQSASGFTNTGSANVTGAGSVLSVVNLTNTGATIVADSGGLLQLGGNFVTANLGTISLTGGTPGTVEITGNLDNTGGNLTGGPFVLNGGTIKNGTVVDTAFSPKINGTLDGATVLGNITVGYTQNLTLTNNGGATLTTTVGTVGQSNGQLLIGANVATQVGSNLVLTGNQTLLNNSGGTRTLTVVAGSNLTRTGSGVGTYSSVFTNLNNAGNIVVNQGTLYDYGTLTNSGNVSVSAGANLLQQSASGFTNTGTANVTGTGSVLAIVNLTNTGGTIIADSGALLQLGGNFVTGNLGTISLTGGTPGTVEITGNLDNTGTNLSGGPFLLNGGTIKNGTITDTAFSPKINGVLDNATVTGNITIGYTQNLTLTNNAGATLTTTVGTVGQTNGQLLIGANVATKVGSDLVLTGSQSLLNNSGGTRTLTITAGSNLTRTGSGAGTYSSVFTNLNNAGNIIVNQGTLYDYGTLASSGNIKISAGANLLQQSSSTFTNTGTANVTGAGSTLSIINLINSGGTIVADSGGLLQLGGNFVTGNLGTISLTGGTPGSVEITGNLDNTGTNLSGGPFLLNGGTIKNGTVTDTAFSPKVNGVLDNTTISGNLTIGNTQNLTLKNGATFTGSATVGTAGQSGGILYLGSPLSLAPGSNLTVTGTSSNILYNNGQTTLTVVPTSSFFRSSPGSTSIQDHLINQGNLVVNGGTLNAQDVTNSANITVTAGNTLSTATGLTQTGGSLQVDGTLFPSSSPGLIVQSGLVSGTGTIQGTTTFNGGTLSPGNSGIGTLTFTGNLTLLGGATTTIELGVGTANNDRISVGGGGTTLTFGGALNIFALSNTYTSGQSWTVFSFPAHAGSFASISLPNTGNGWVWDTSQLTTTGVLTLTTFVPVPEPSTYALLATGLGIIFLLRRRRAR